MRWADDEDAPVYYGDMLIRGEYPRRSQGPTNATPVVVTKDKPIVGLDLGQVSDSSALAVINRLTTGGAEPIFQATYLHRWPTGTAYPKIVEGVVKMLEGDSFKHQPLRQRPVLVIDATGVGRPVADMFRGSKLGALFMPVVITGGHQVNTEGGTYYVPKRLLVSTVQMLLQTRRFKFAEALPEAATLVSEMQNFQLTITEQANDTYEGRKGSHDDLLLAVALGLWAGVSLKPIPRSSPPVSYRTG
jgi:hypothetical protein